MTAPFLSGFACIAEGAEEPWTGSTADEALVSLSFPPWAGAGVGPVLAGGADLLTTSDVLPQLKKPHMNKECTGRKEERKVLKNEWYL